VTAGVTQVRPEALASEHALVVEPERREGLLNGRALGVDALGALGGGKVGRRADAGAGDIYMPSLRVWSYCRLQVFPELWHLSTSAERAQIAPLGEVMNPVAARAEPARFRVSRSARAPRGHALR
jgi:hypothetical protein